MSINDSLQNVQMYYILGNTLILNELCIKLFVNDVKMYSRLYKVH